MQSTTPLRILVVDDYDDAATALSMLMKQAGHHPCVVTGGEAALTQAPLFRPDTMLIDLAMPKIDGLSLARELRRMPDFSETPLIAMSGYVDREQREKAMEAGFTYFLAKPFTFATLQTTLDAVAARLKTSRQMAEQARLAAERTRELNKAARAGLDQYYQRRRATEAIPVKIERSGISRIVSLPERPGAEELRRWLKSRSCRVGPVFEFSPGQFSFFVYSRRHEVCGLVAAHAGFRLVSETN